MAQLGGDEDSNIEMDPGKVTAAFVGIAIGFVVTLVLVAIVIWGLNFYFRMKSTPTASQIPRAMTLEDTEVINKPYKEVFLYLDANLHAARKLTEIERPRSREVNEEIEKAIKASKMILEAIQENAAQDKDLDENPPVPNDPRIKKSNDAIGKMPEKDGTSSVPTEDRLPPKPPVKPSDLPEPKGVMFIPERNSGMVVLSYQ